MTIELYTFYKPLNVSDQSKITLEIATLFGRKETIPSGHVRNITPDGYRDTYILTTFDNPNSPRLNTIADIEVYPKEGHSVSQFDVHRNTGIAILTEDRHPNVKRRIDSSQPCFVFVRPNILDNENGKGIRVDRMVVYSR